MLESTVSQRVLPVSVGSVLLIEGSPDLPRLFVLSVQIFSDKSATSLRNFAFVAYPVYAVFVNFSKEYKACVFQNGCSLVGVLRLKP